MKARRQPTQAIYQPLGGGDKQFLGPLNDRGNGALFGVASVAVPIGDSTLVARLRWGAGRSGSISLEVNGQPAGTVEILLAMMMILIFNSSTTTGPPRSRRGRQPR